MQITPFDIYLASLADPLGEFFTGIMVVLIIGLIGSGIGFFLGLDDDDEHVLKFCKNLFKKLILPFLIFAFLSTIIPSTKTVYEMYIIPTVAKSQMVQKLPDDIQKYIDHFVEEEKK